MVCRLIQMKVGHKCGSALNQHTPLLLSVYVVVRESVPFNKGAMKPLKA